MKWEEYYGKKNTPSWHKDLSSRDERRVCRHASIIKNSSKKFFQRAWLNICPKMICSINKSFGRYIYAAKLPMPQLQQKHKIERLNFSQHVMPEWYIGTIRTDFFFLKNKREFEQARLLKVLLAWFNEKERSIHQAPFEGSMGVTWGCIIYNDVGSIAFVSD